MSDGADLGATLKVLSRLVAFDSTSRNSNLALIEWVEAYLAARGIASERVLSDDGAKANLIARIGPEAPGGVVLSGHTDVVPVDGQDWQSDPFQLIERDDKYFARGAADMKSFLALALAHVDLALAADLKRPLYLAFSYDEEVGCLGAPRLIERLAAIAAPEAVIVGEPTMMKVVSAHKGISVFEVEVEGKEAHSSRTDLGVSAIMEALKLVRLVEDMAGEARASGEGLAFHPPGATMTIGQIEGGTASNILARRCRFVWDLRAPNVDIAEIYTSRFMEAADALDRDIKARCGEGGVVVKRRSNTPPLKPDYLSAAEQLARALTGDNGQTLASYAAEAGLFQRAGMPVVICGPGDIAQAHQTNEWIARRQLEEGQLFMRRLIARLSEADGIIAR